MAAGEETEGAGNALAETNWGPKTNQLWGSTSYPSQPSPIPASPSPIPDS